MVAVVAMLMSLSDPRSSGRLILLRLHLGLELSHRLADCQNTLVTTDTSPPGRCHVTASQDAHFRLSSAYLLSRRSVGSSDSLRPCLRVMSRMGANEMQRLIAIHVAVLVVVDYRALARHVLRQEVLLGTRELATLKRQWGHVDIAGMLRLLLLRIAASATDFVDISRLIWICFLCLWMLVQTTEGLALFCAGQLLLWAEILSKHVRELLRRSRLDHLYRLILFEQVIGAEESCLIASDWGLG